jgi:hypothetical protein
MTELLDSIWPNVCADNEIIRVGAHFYRGAKM